MKMGETRFRDREKKLLQRSWEVSDKRDLLEIRVVKTVSCYMLGLCPRSQASRGLMWQFVGPTNRIVLESKVPARPLVQPIFIFYPARPIFSKLCRKRHAFSLAAILKNRDGGIRGPAVSSASKYYWLPYPQEFILNYASKVFDNITEHYVQNDAVREPINSCSFPALIILCSERKADTHKDPLLQNLATCRSHD
jgi:hypothetical protein